MQKFNRIELTETHYEKNNLWCYEIIIQFNAIERWIPTLNNKMILMMIKFVDGHPLRKIRVEIDHILPNKKITLFVKKFKCSVFYNYVINFIPTQSLLVSHFIGDYSASMCFSVNLPLIGIFIFVLDKNKVCTLALEFSNIELTINNKFVNVGQKEIFKLEPNIYYIPIVPWKIMEQKVITTNKCCWCNFRTHITLQIENINCDRKNSESSKLCCTPICYHNIKYVRGKIE